MAQAKIDPKLAREQLWRRAHLSWMLDSNQQDLYKLFHENASKIQTWLLARRSGKSYSLCVLAIEYCLKHPNSVIKYVAPTKDQVENFILPIIDNDILTKGCPDDLKPQYIKQKKQYRFSNGSCIQLCGAESGNIDSIRGGFAHIAVIDEAQDVTKLRYSISSVLLPTLLTTGGKLLISGTPPQDQDHEFLGIIEEAEASGTLIKRTVYDNPRLTKEQIKQIADAMGGEHKEEFQREFLCKLIKSASRSVLPEVDDDLLKKIVKEWKRPPFFHSYVSMDIGFRDWTVVLYGYFDHRANKLIIEDEITAFGPEMKLKKLTDDMIAMEKKLFTHPVSGEFVKPKDRVCDHDLIVINEIKNHSNYGISFNLANKHERMAGINNLKTLLSSEQIIINPRCKTLIRHLKDGKWKGDSREEFAKCPLGSHYDGIPALVYLTRAIDYKANPYPSDYESPLRYGDSFYVPGTDKTNIQNADVYKKMFNLKQTTQERKNSWIDILKNRK